MKKVLVLGFLILAGSLLVYAGEPDFHTESGFGLFSDSYLPLLSISLGSNDPLSLNPLAPGLFLFYPGYASGRML